MNVYGEITRDEVIGSESLTITRGEAMRRFSEADVRRLRLLVILAALAAPISVHSQTIGNIKIGPVDKAWAIKPSSSGGLIFDLALGDASQHCAVNIDGGRMSSGDAATDFDNRWKALAGSASVAPTTEKKALTMGWTSSFGERAGRTSKGGYRTLALFTITNGSRTQSVAASANDERCLPALKALVRTVAVMDAATDQASANRAASSTPSAAATASSIDDPNAKSYGSSRASADLLRAEDLIGRWHGLKTIPGMGFNGGPALLMRSVQFMGDGTYVSEEPNTRGRYQIQGNTVTLPNLYILTFQNGYLYDGEGVLIRQKSR